MRPLKAGEITKTLTGTRQFRLNELPWFNFQEITALGEGCGARSSFYFLALAAQKQRLEAALGRPVVGYLSRAGFCCEATIGYADGIGFRGGVCYPFKAYDLKAGREIDILEIPLAVMDRTFEGYMLARRRKNPGDRPVPHRRNRTLPWGVHPFSGMIPA